MKYILYSNLFLVAKSVKIEGFDRVLAQVLDPTLLLMPLTEAAPRIQRPLEVALDLLQPMWPQSTPWVEKKLLRCEIIIVFEVWCQIEFRLLCLLNLF